MGKKGKEKAPQSTVTVSAIQKTARILFLKNGYKETTIRMIADEIGISPATIYLYYDNKKALFESLEIPEAEELSPKQDQVYSNILNSALLLFGKNGFQQTSMTDIADQAGVSKATLYRNFDHKEDILSEILTTSNFNMLAKRAVRNETQSSWIDSIMEIGRSYLMIAADKERSGLLRCIVAESHNYPEIGRRYYEEGFNAACNDIVEYLKREIKKSNLKLRKNYNLHTAAQTYIGSLLSYILLSSIVPADAFHMNAQEYLDLSTHVFINGIFEAVKK